LWLEASDPVPFLKAGDFASKSAQQFHRLPFEPGDGEVFIELTSYCFAVNM
jgi:hypothetical protein